jgi:thioredoxin-disulfide reductase
MYDVIVIGSGPAGLTAAIYAARRALKVLVLGKEPGGQAIYASEVENYPGFGLVSGFELMQKMAEQAKTVGAEIIQTEVEGILKEGDILKVKDKDGKIFESKTIILAFGAVPRKLGIPDEERFKGCGISYCATCDAPFYKNKIAAVVGGGNAALDAAILLSKFAKKVYLVHRRDGFRAEEARIDEIKSLPNVEMVLSSKVTGLGGDKKICSLAIENTAGEKREVEVSGVFVEIGHIVESDFVKKLVALDENQQIIINQKNETNLPGVFAAGDATTVPYKQIVIAAGEGAKAALSAYSYLQKLKVKN